MKQIFISYSRKDQAAVERLTKRLKADGVKIWIDREGIRAGEQWRRSIVEALRASDAVLLMLSPNSVESDGVRKELDLTDELRKKIIPVELTPTGIPTEIAYQLSGLQRIKLSIDFEQAVRQIEIAIEIAAPSPSAADAATKAPGSDRSSPELEWLEKAYTAVGAFCFTWALAALFGIYTRGSVKIPAVGDVTFTETVVYTLYLFTFAVPLLLVIVLRHRALQNRQFGTQLLPVPRFSKLGESGMPPVFRTLAFLALVVYPVLAQEIAYSRLYNEISIAWKPHKWWRTIEYQTVLNRADLFTFPAKPDNRDYANWRFMRLDLPEWGVVDRKPRGARPEDSDGRPDDAKLVEPVQLTAYPGIAPWLFRISAHASAAVAAWLLLSRDGSLLRRFLGYLRRPRTGRSRSSPRPK